MKFSINLYPPELHPKLRLLSVTFLIAFWAGIILVAVIANSYFLFSQQKLTVELEQLQNNYQQQTVLLNSLQAELNNLVVEPKLMAEVSQKQLISKMKKRVYVELVGQEKQKSTGFADLMLELAENHQKELWLTRIYLNSSDVIIEGSTANSAAIPIWVNSLGKSNYFKGQTFSDTRIFRHDEGQLNFILTTDIEGNRPKVLIHD